MLLCLIGGFKNLVTGTSKLPFPVCRWYGLTSIISLCSFICLAVINNEAYGPVLGI